MRVVAIDFGKKRIGLAITDPSGKIALPYKTILSAPSLAGCALNVKKELKNQLPEIETIIVGNPLFSSGEKSSMSNIVEKFVEELKKIFDIPILMVDEGLTSYQADEQLKELGLNRKQRSALSDTSSALIILQSYLN